MLTSRDDVCVHHPITNAPSRPLTPAPTTTVAGPGVIGHHPILHAGGSPFSYCSLTHVDISSYNGLPASLIGESNWMEGYFTFEEHVDDPSRSQPMRTVRANVPRFHLAFPDVLL